MAGSVRVWRRIRVGRYATLNLATGGVSVSVGVRGRRLTIGRRGVTVSVGAPGSGVSYRTFWSWKQLMMRRFGRR